MAINSTGGTKHDSTKRRVDLLPVDALEGIADILTHGAQKYGDRNWEEGIHFHRLYGAILRHLFAFWRGEDFDPESGLPHLDHAGCELLFLSAMWRRRRDLDDRPKGGRLPGSGRDAVGVSRIVGARNGAAQCDAI